MEDCKGKIEDWVAYFDNRSLDAHFHIMGTMNGSPISTSRIISFDGMCVRTRNSIYELGFPKINKYGAWNVCVQGQSQ